MGGTAHREEQAADAAVKYTLNVQALHRIFGEGTITKIDQKRTKIDVTFADGTKLFIIEKSSTSNAFTNGFLKLEE